MSISPSGENIVQEMSVSRPEVNPGCLMPHRETEEGVDQKDTVFRTRSQKKEAVIVTVTETMGTQHSMPGSVVCPDADVEVTKDN
ncbi:unnamed protein product [Schistocephalus solidus]|uniref:Uncharacterized protein n=1 Tax=Schistocephalus solidus TaxID=70667 RepID=A0A3P7DKG1_SCHSO|nr:unnamed protein product [Schistocephalus solidus]